jgi:hypothetical protein
MLGTHEFDQERFTHPYLRELEEARIRRRPGRPFLGGSGGTPERVSDRVAYEGEPSWSPDGTRIAFVPGGDPDNSPGIRIHVVPAP